MLSGTMIGMYEIKCLNTSQVNQFYNFIERNRTSFADTMPVANRVISIDTALVELNVIERKNNEGKGYYYALYNDETMIGYFLIREIDKEAEWAEIGYAIDKKWTGKGLVTKACKLLLEEIFEILKLNKAVICCNDDNENSKAMAERLGFKQEGILRDYCVVNYKRRNMVVYGLLISEYKMAPKS